MCTFWWACVCTIFLDQHVFFDKVCARATSDWVVGCLALAEDWTERVPLDQLFREAVSRVGPCKMGWENFV